MDKNLDIIAVGECLLELSTNCYFENTNSFNLSFGGDVITSAAAAQNLGAKTGIITAVGDDYFKNIILDKLNSQGFELSNVKICNEKNGLYLCGHTEKRELMTYRNRVAGSSLSLEDYNEEYIKLASAIYTTGITQALSIQANELVRKIFETARNNDIITAYDPNYTSSFMTKYDIKEYLEDIIENIDILFISLKNDVEPLYNLMSVEKIVDYFSGYGVKTIVIKSHPEKGYYVYHNGMVEFCEYYFKGQALHTMGAGDVFNGGFLASIVKGCTPFEAARMASKQAGIFIERSGLICNIPRMEELLRG